MAKKHEHKSEISIRISGLSSGIHEYHFSADPSLIGLESNFRDPVEIDAQLDKNPRQIYLKASIQTSGQFQCDRCLDDFNRSLSTAYHMCFVWSELEKGKFPPEDIQVISPDAIVLDLTEEIRQSITLAVPLKLLCNDDCKGLCSTCGANWNHSTCDCRVEMTDPRLQGLKDLLHR